VRGSTLGTEEKSCCENGKAANQVEKHSVLISCAIDQVREHRDLLRICRYTARAMHGRGALQGGCNRNNTESGREFRLQAFSERVLYSSFDRCR
jgi:hypothetical protein